MKYSSLIDFLTRQSAALSKGPVGVILAEDGVELESTIRHHIDLGFPVLLVLGHAAMDLPDDLAADSPTKIHRIDFELNRRDAAPLAINPIIAAVPAGTWLYYCFNAEYLFFPFCESRTIGEVLSFHTEERRASMLSYVIDLYTGDLEAHPNGVDTENAMFDKAGYYALARLDPENHDHPKERQLDFFGGLRWRFEEHVPAERRKIDRIALFRAKPGLKLRPDHTFNDEEYNTYSCPWHHNLTCATASFRVAKALKFNPGSTYDVHSFTWVNSERFNWSSQQLMDLGLIEPGQWF
ncbi:hypothetical protein B6V74_06800 [Thioclava sp. F42-5]|uniref:glycosyltransferase family 2 protein n=1 Tax=unclassified Thioclava TaxID=2621713 RepID=UPI000B543F73|nr:MULTISPECIES: glycosyltransferase family 2 protein [unclassified Thioclava]OWY09719.1 hypothetical protein B6V74_06800 [Thioclava sp. F42-5]PWE51659.1 hypothetical protein DEM26_01470 [Thioclava sp. NG1]